jgi:hypothetical protein
MLRNLQSLRQMPFSAATIYIDIAAAAGSHDVKEQSTLCDNLFGDKCRELRARVSKRSAPAGERATLSCQTAF